MSTSPYLSQAFDYSSVELKSPSTEIRLLQLYPSHPHESDGEKPDTGPIWDDSLVCHLYTTPIDNPENFKALSYVWGDDTKTKSITVVGSTPTGKTPGSGAVSSQRTSVIRITESLSTALRSLRGRRQDITLWIDQICINQADNDEKGQQVGLMGAVYSRATQVLVWLGPAADGSDALMDAFKSIGQGARDFGIESYLTRERYHLIEPMVSDEQPDDPATKGLQELLDSTAEAFAELLKDMTFKNWISRPYFSRAWIVQEFCLCADTVFVCGATKTLPVELIMFGLLMLKLAIGNAKRSNYTALLLPLLPLQRLQEVNQEPMAQLLSCRAIRQKHGGEPLYKLLRKCFVGHDTRAREHRDRVFALLGLAADADRLGIRPDYGVSDACILTRTARALIEMNGRVDTLCYSQFPKAIDHLPSWVPDWRSNLRPSFYTVNEVTNPHLFAASGKDSVLEAVAPTNEEEDQKHALGLRGWFVDVIEKIAEGDGWTDLGWDHIRYRHFFTQVDDLWKCSMEKNDPIHGDDTTATRRRKEEARWRVPIGDVYWTVEEGSQRASTDVAVYHGHTLKNIQYFERINQITPVDNYDRENDTSDWQERHRNGEVGQNYHDSMVVMKDKRPFLTQLGYLGMGPLEAQPGDAVVIFCGGQIPFVVRPLGPPPDGFQARQQSIYSFVGEAYCDGVMDGELIVKEKQTFFLS
ncbi:heterokaryon incompatibility protein-domain-containing protein [Lasiosphaeria hispida]|uniref:Heterokaryon incompatibility protein-domain-containing protein n=1 Tax=Lasiosphaeria hispida TaxID=260671 RepID=A0AAJ0MBR7_9PEZI|nr:heterokaryon incompatibility protein-domain-containing protein [Lasiosphaeria hispida]